MPSRYLTRTEVLDFFSSQLNLHLTEGELTGPPSLELLQKICTAFSQNVPYSTIRYLNVPLADRCIPTLEQVKQIGLHRRGGLCYETNVFLHWLLAGVGFDIDFLYGTAYRYGKNPNHALNVVRVEGKDYLVDGGSYPMVNVSCHFNMNIFCILILRSK